MEQCPLCNTERVSGDDYCKCGYEFSSTEPEPQPDLDSIKPNSDADWPEGPKSALQSDEDWVKEHGQPKEDVPSELQTDKEWAENQDSRIRTDPQQEKQESSYEARVVDGISHYYIEDGVTSVQEKNSANGTKVNGQDITGQGRKELENDDVIELSRMMEVTFQSTKTNQKKTMSTDEIVEHTCPKCNKVNVKYHEPPTEEENELIEKSFGWRGNRIQSWCRMCRS